MNENINLCEILKDAPKGTKLWSPVVGDCILERIEPEEAFPIVVLCEGNGFYFLTKEGFYAAGFDNAECVLFPSKDQRDWSKFVAPEVVSVPVTLHPFDRVLVRNDDEWMIEFFDHYQPTETTYHPFMGASQSYKYCIPYNKETAHLLGTKKECPIRYELSFSMEFKDE